MFFSHFLGGLDGGGGGPGLSRTTGPTCGGNSPSRIEPAGRPALRFSTCGGSSGRPGCSNIAACRWTKGTTGGGGALRVIGGRGGCGAGALFAIVGDTWFLAFPS